MPGDPLTYYVAGANGGIIKTTNGGTTFTPIFDKAGAASIGAIAIARSDRNVIYVGTGEGNPRNNASVGDGMYKSVDGGVSWTVVLTASTNVLTVPTTRTIQGAGQIGVDLMGLNNQGLIDANQSTLLMIDPSAAGVTNTGTLRATNSATLRFSGANGGSFTNTGGTIGLRWEL